MLYLDRSMRGANNYGSRFFTKPIPAESSIWADTASCAYFWGS